MKKAQERGTGTTLDAKHWDKLREDSINAVVGSLAGADCADCLNKGYIATVKDGAVTMRECTCMDRRNGIKRIAKSGLSSIMQECTFANYRTEEPWQTDAKYKAQEYVSDYKSKWFLACGSVGSGKTHLCTAICGELLNSGKDVRYMLWKDESAKLKANINDDMQYFDLINPLKNARVLYIDDFWKTKKGEPPSTGDINLAFELLNYRYNCRDKATIISCERTPREMIDVDEAVGSRIWQRSKDSNVIITGKHNYRLR